MAKTLVEKVDSPDLDVTIFKISGTLGFHENQVLTKFFNECSNRGIHKLIMDFSDLGSLGGGCAKIIREAAANGQVRLCIVGASKTVQGFLEKKGPTAIKVDRRAYERIMRHHQGQSVVFHLNVMEGEKKLKDYSVIVKEEQHALPKDEVSASDRGLFACLADQCRRP